MRRVGVLLLVVSCGPEIATSTTEGSPSGAASTGDDGTTAASPTTTDATGSSGSTGGPPARCECVKAEPVECYPRGCIRELPLSCALLDLDNPDLEATTCILGLLKERAEALFSYCSLCDEGYESYHGEFLIRGPEPSGVDFKCHTLDLGSESEVTFLAIDPPEHFEGCLALATAGEQLDCLLAGLHAGAPVPTCGG